MAEPEKVKYARQVVAQQMLADAVVGVKLLWEDYPLLSEGEFAVVEKLALQVSPPPWEQFEAAYDFLASLADDADEVSRARGVLDAGTFLSSGLATFTNGTTAPEPVFTRSQWAAIEAAAEGDAAPCKWARHSWSYFRPTQVDPYWMRCKHVGSHEVHEDADTGATWTNDTEGAQEL